MDAALGTLVRKIGNRVQLLIPITMLILGLMASTMGIYEEVYGLFPVFVGIFVALGYDAVVGGAVIFLGVSIGYAAAPRILIPSLLHRILQVLNFTQEWDSAGLFLLSQRSLPLLM